MIIVRSSCALRVSMWFAFLMSFTAACLFAQEAPVDFPTRPEPGLREGFQTPPEGYGEVPFWWWTGEKLDVERLKWQLDELKKKGVSGVQVNYAHQDVRNAVNPNWITYPNEPEVLTDEWFEVFDQIREHCRELNMGIGVSGYTLDWQNSPGNLFDRLIYSDAELQSRDLYVSDKIQVKTGQGWSSVFTQKVGAQEDPIVGIVAYRSDDFRVVRAFGTDVEKLKSNDEHAECDAQLWVYRAKRRAHTLNPLHRDSGKRVVERFFQPFEVRAEAAYGDQAEPSSTLGLNYFFQDELQIGTGALIWCDDLESEFEARKGYSLWQALPATYGQDCGDLTEKYRLDFMDVRVRLAEERYFIPIFNWNARRGRIYACDPGSRGRDPSEFCDYFSAIRWYTAPGHDTPGGNADFIKNKVSSSIAHFYGRPRVWLEGYHSFGWGATPERLLFATNENFLFGANLLNLHGLYYTTYGGYWEWAPPCYHFRQPYWETFASFLKYFERLSFALTRGVEQPDFVVLYPVSSYQSGTGGARARDVAFEAARRVFDSGHDVLFIDDDSLARAEVVDGRLNVAGARHRVLILPSTRGIRIGTLRKALELYRAGGVVVALDALPEATDAAGRRDAELVAFLDECFNGRISSIKRSEEGGVAAFFSPIKDEGDPSDKIGSGDAVSKLRRYPDGFEGHWVWSSELQRDVRFKWVVEGLSDESRDYQVLFFCDNSGAMYVNGDVVCSDADYRSGWRGTVSLRNGDVVTLDGHDDDTPRRGSAGLFWALMDQGRTVATAENFRCASGRSDEAWRRDSSGVDELAAVDVGNVHVLHRTGVNTELGGTAATSAAPGDDATMWSRFEAFMEEFPRDVFDSESGRPCRVMKRATEDADIYFVMKGRRGAKLVFRSTGRAELYNAWDGSRRAVKSTLCTTADGQSASEVLWPYDEKEAGLLVFWRNEAPVESEETETFNHEKTVALDGEWGFRLKPTLDNRWGDFRLPIHDELIGAEAQRFSVSVGGVETAHNALNDLGPKYLLLGPLPDDVDFDALDAKLASLDAVRAGETVVVDDVEYAWKIGSFSWRWGVEGNPGREGYHGLKEKIDSRFIALGKPGGGFNETVFGPEEGGSVYYLWTTTPVAFRGASTPASSPIVDAYASGDAPEKIWLGGRSVDFSDAVSLTTTEGRGVPTLLRWRSAGRRAFVFVVRAPEKGTGASELIMANGLDEGAFNGLATGLREETPNFVSPGKRTPLSTIWFDVPGTLDYDVFGGTDDSPRRLKFTAPPGTSGLSFVTRGGFVALYVDGVKAETKIESEEIPGWEYWRGMTREERFGAGDAGLSTFSDATLTRVNLALTQTLERTAELELELTPIPGVSDAALLPEPIRLTCVDGVTTLGDWNTRGVLENYSGGARYSKSFDWRPEEGERVTLDLGALSASCRVWLNGREVGDIPAPPWTLDVTDALVEGKNVLEIDVYNTAANFWRNIPTNYGSCPASGLFGPVTLRQETR